MDEIQTSLLAPGWWLVGNGPAYLLFYSPPMEVTHLSTGLFPELREGLRGYSVIRDNDELAPFVRELIMASADAIYDGEGRIVGRDRSLLADYIVLRAVIELIQAFPQRAIFEQRLSGFATCLRAAGLYRMYHGPPGAPSGQSPSPNGSFFAHDQCGQRLFTSTKVYRCEPDSPFAHCAQELWRRSSSCTAPYRVPTRKELREYICSIDSTVPKAWDEAAITKLCRREGFGWLPRAPGGRKPKRGSSPKS